MERSLMEDPSRCPLLPEGQSSPREEVAEEVAVVVAAAVVVFEAEVALVAVPRLTSGEETGLVPTALVET